MDHKISYHRNCSKYLKYSPSNHSSLIFLMEKKIKNKRHVSSNQNTVRSDTGTSSDLTFVRLDQSRTPELKSKKWTGLNLCAAGFFFENQCSSYCGTYLKVIGKAFPNVTGGYRSEACPGITLRQNRPPRWEAPRKAQMKQCKVNAESQRENFLQGLQCLRMSAGSLGQMAVLSAPKQNPVLLLELPLPCPWRLSAH